MHLIICTCTCYVTNVTVHGHIHRGLYDHFSLLCCIHTHSRTIVHHLKENVYAIGSMTIINRSQIPQYTQDHPLIRGDRATINIALKLDCGLS